MRLVRKAIPFSRITRNAGANHIFPGGQPSSIARHDVVQIEIGSLKEVAAILTSVLVAFENIVSSEFNFLLRQPIEKQKDNHPRNTNLHRNGSDHLVLGRGGGEIPPALEIVREKIIGRDPDLRTTSIAPSRLPSSNICVRQCHLRLVFLSACTCD
jgi:hypothetical protein